MNEANSPDKSRALKPQNVPGIVTRRRLIALASTTAALGLGGCGMMNSTASRPESTYLLETDSRPVVLTKQQEVAKKAQEFAATIDAADKNAVKPATTADTRKPASVILASTGSETPASAEAPAAASPAPTHVTSPAPAIAIAPAAEPAKPTEAAKTVTAAPTPPAAPVPAAAPVAIATASPPSSGVNGAMVVPSTTISPIATPRETITPAALSSTLGS